MKKQISIKLVLERFKENESRPTSYYLGVEPEDFRPIANKMTLKLKELGVLNEQEKEVKPFTSEVVEAFGINYEVLNEEVENKMKRDFGEIIETLTKGKGFKGMDPDEMKEIVKDPLSVMRSLQKNKPNDKIVFVAKVLTRQGMKKATVEMWFLTSFFLSKLAKAKSLKLLGKGMETLKYFSGR